MTLSDRLTELAGELPFHPAASHELLKLAQRVCELERHAAQMLERLRTLPA